MRFVNSTLLNEASGNHIFIVYLDKLYEITTSFLQLHFTGNNKKKIVSEKDREDPRDTASY